MTDNAHYRTSAYRTSAYRTSAAAAEAGVSGDDELRANWAERIIVAVGTALAVLVVAAVAVLIGMA